MDKILNPNNIRPIIGFAGKAAVGKDTCASMAHYIIKTQYEGTFDTWYARYTKGNYGAKQIIHMADKLKDITSELFDIPRICFDRRDTKDFSYYCFDTKQFVDFDDITTDDKPYVVFTNDETSKNLSQLLACNERMVATKLRTLLQYVGTEICRRQLDPDMWANFCMGAAYNIKQSYGYCLIADIRFENEIDVIHKNKGIVVKVERNLPVVITNHECEKDLIGFDYVINNNGTFQNTFNKVSSLLKIIYNSPR